MQNEIGQLFVVGLEGPELRDHEREFLVKNNIGGVILFSRNLTDPVSLHKLCFDLQSLSAKLPNKHPFLISIDMEGGRVHRLKPPFTQWPALEKVSQLDSTSIAFKFANMMGAELRAMGINLDFAPCVDVLTNPNNVLIGDRSLGSDPEHVAKMASALVRGYIKAGVIPCAKHFPGHGNTVIDSHEDLPVEQVTLEEMRNRELIPFKKTFRARMDLVMTAHIKYEKIDPEFPATLSPLFLKKLLREEMRYRNVVMSDDLDMKALTNNYSREEIPVLALQAGCDMLLYCNDPTSHVIGIESVRKAISEGKIDQNQLKESLRRVNDLKAEYLKNPLPLPLSDATKIVGHPDHLKLAKAIVEGQVPEELRTT